MFNLRLSNTIRTFVQLFRDTVPASDRRAVQNDEGNGLNGKGLLITGWYRVETPSGTQYNERAATGQAFHILVAFDHKAFVGFCPRADISQIKSSRDPEKYLQMLKNVGNHDACWIDSIDTAMTEVYFEACSDVLTRSGLKLCPCDLDSEVYFDKAEVVGVTLRQDTERNKEHGFNYWYQVSEPLQELSKAS